MDKDIVKAIKELADNDKKLKKGFKFDDLKEPMASVVSNQHSTAFELPSFEDGFEDGFDDESETEMHSNANAVFESLRNLVSSKNSSERFSKSSQETRKKSEPEPVKFPRISNSEPQPAKFPHISKPDSEPEPAKFPHISRAEIESAKYSDKVKSENIRENHAEKNEKISVQPASSESEKLVRGSSVEMSYDELDSIVKGISGKNMKNLLCSIAKHDSYNFIGLISNDKFNGVVNAIKMVMRNYKEKNILLDKADFTLCDDIIHAVVIDYYKPLIKKYGNIDLNANLKDIDQIVYFITNVLDKYYSDVAREYDKLHDVKLNTFFARAVVGRKVDKIITSNRIWSVYTVSNSHYSKFIPDIGVENYIIKNFEGCILRVSSNYISTSSNLPDEFNVYLNKSSKEYIALSYLIRVLYKCRNELNNAKSESSSGFYDDGDSIGYKYFISGIIGCFANYNNNHENVSYNKDISKALASIIGRYFTDIDLDSEIQLDDIAVTVINAYFESFDDDEFLSSLNDNDFMLDEIMTLVSEIIKDSSMLTVHNEIVSCLIKQLAHICAGSTNVTKGVISYMLRCIPFYDGEKMQVDLNSSYNDILENEIASLKK